MKQSRCLMAALAVACLVAAGFAFDVAIFPALAAEASRSLSGFDATGFAFCGVLSLPDLLKKRNETLSQMDTLAKGDQTDETRSKFDALEKDLTTLDGDIKRAQFLRDAQRSAAEQQAPPVEQPGGDGGAGGQNTADPVLQRSALPAAVAPQRDVGLEFGGFVRSYAQAQFATRNGLSTSPAQEATKIYGERHPVTGEVTRAQTASSASAGGFLIPPTYVSGIIGMFRPRTIVRRRGTVVPANGIYIKGKTGASVGYIGEGQQPSTAGVTFGTMAMTEKDIGAILPISKKLLRHDAYGVEAYCRDELISASALFEDGKFLYGTGTGKEVKGYRYAILLANIFEVANKTAPTNAEVRTELRKVLKALATANVPVDQNNPAWFMHPATKMYLEDLYQGDVKAFPTLEGPTPTLMGYPVETTTQITGPSGDGGDIFFGAHSYALIGDSVAMRLETSDTASFVDASGNQVNLWAQDMFGIKLVMSHDFGLRYDQAFAVLTKVKWGQ